jgi:hypothetical protein
LCYATTNQIFMSHQGSKQQLQNNNIVDMMIMFYIVFQEATTTATMINCNKHARSCKQQTTLFVDVNQLHQRSQRREAPAIRLTTTPQHNVNNATIILYHHIARSDNNNRQMQGKNVMTPTQQSNVHVVVRRMQQ